MGEVESDEALMAAYQKGDRRAFQRLFDRLAPRVHAFFMRSFSNPATADDLLQVTFLKVHRARDQYRTGAPVRPWLFAIAARARLDELRRHYRLPPQADEEELDRVGGEVDPPALDLERAERGEQVRAAMQRLPESQRVVVHLHHVEGMTFPEIGAVLGIKEGAAKLRAFRGYEHLRRELAPLVEKEG